MWPDSHYGRRVQCPNRKQGDIGENQSKIAKNIERPSVLSRTEPFVRSPLSRGERDALWAAIASRCRWVRVYYLWRPNLPDEADNRLVELAVAGGAEAIVTHNTRDFERTELHFPGLRVVTPGELIAED